MNSTNFLVPKEKPVPSASLHPPPRSRPSSRLSALMGRKKKLTARDSSNEDEGRDESPSEGATDDIATDDAANDDAEEDEVAEED